MATVSALAKVGLFYLMVRFFFPPVFLTPAMVLAGAVFVAGFVARFQVLLDRAAGQVAITIGLWTKRVPLIQIERVDEVLRFGAEITMLGGMAFTYRPFWKRRRLARWLRIRTGFEGMEVAITQAAAAARAADPGGAAAAIAAGQARRSRRTIPQAFLVCACGLVSLAVAVAVQPQAGGWLVPSVAMLLRIYFGAGGVLALLIAAGILHGALRNRHAAHPAG